MQRIVLAVLLGAILVEPAALRAQRGGAAPPAEGLVGVGPWGVVASRPRSSAPSRAGSRLGRCTASSGRFGSAQSLSSLGLFARNAAATRRRPRGGPMLRHRSAASGLHAAAD